MKIFPRTQKCIKFTLILAKQFIRIFLHSFMHLFIFFILQEITIPKILQGHCVMAAAETGKIILGKECVLGCRCTSR